MFYDGGKAHWPRRKWLAAICEIYNGEMAEILI